MAAGGGNFESALRLRLTFHVAQIGIARRGIAALRFGPRQGLPAGQMRADLEQRARLIDVSAVDERSLDLLGVDFIRQRDAARELADRTFATMKRATFRSRGRALSRSLR